MKPLNLQCQIDEEILLDLTESYLKALIFEVSDLSNADYDSFAPFMELGLDSFHVLKIVKKLEDDFGFLPKTLLFESFNINDLAFYFIKKHEQTLLAKFAKELQDPSTLINSTERQLIPVKIVPETVVKPTQSITVVNQTNTTRHQMPILILENEAFAHHELGELIQELFNRYKNEGSSSRGTRNIAPNLFIGSEMRGYFNYGRCKNLILVYAYTGPQDYFTVIAREIQQHCVDNNFELNIFSVDQIESIGNIPFSATPFGVVSRIVNLQNFTLQGNKMRRLRYQVSKFEDAGICKTEEYHCGSNKETDLNIARIIDQWCAARTMVNPMIFIVREEILEGTLCTEHRLFLTYSDDVLQNVILISSLSAEENGYLMDLEFYPKDMPLGGLEFAIVKIIETLVAEGCCMLSLGGTYGCKLAPSSNADPDVDKILDFLREQNIFNDAGNLQFKNKFRPDSASVFLCRAVGKSNPDNVTDIIMMIADPSKMQTSDEENHSFSKPLDRVTTPRDETARYETSDSSGAMIVHKAVQEPDRPAERIEGGNRPLLLADYGYNPLNVPDEHVEYDLKTDSWAQLQMPSIEKHMRRLHADLQNPANIDESLQGIFPFAYFVVTNSGRTAEHAFCKAWAKKGIVLQNLLFPTTIYHQIDNGFTPREIPHPEVFQLNSEEPYKGNLDWETLKEQVELKSESIAYVCIEVNDNAAGGCAVSMEHLNKVKSLLSEYSIPLVIDGTRILENARFLIEHEKDYAGKDIWDVAKEIFSCADAVIASLPKDFCVSKGGVIATNDAILFHKLQDLVLEEGIGLDVVDKKVIALSLRNRKKIETLVSQRMEWVQLVWKALKKHDIPVVSPAGGHCILIDVKQLPEFGHFDYPAASFIAWMFLNTGIRAGAHNAGMQKNSAINDLVRLAIPVGLKREQVEEIIDKLIVLFQRKENIPEIFPERESYGDIHAKFNLKKYHNVFEKLPPKATVSASVPQRHAAVSHSIPDAKETENNQAMTNQKSTRSKDIAIVGMAGRYPKAKNLNELWENLTRGRDCVDVIPDSRLEGRKLYGGTEKYRGGFLEDVDKFDSLFFNISPREAELLDPQERLFLEAAWEAVEDAGYYPETLARENGARDIGVFVGAVWTMYQMVGLEEKHAGNTTYPSSFLWSIANRVSYWMNLSGPSLTLDTACSSSLTALYLACEAINKGDCSGAIVGGVNLDLHQSKFEINAMGGALSKDGVCRSFGKGANGYVAGEGVGALYLKPLDKAVQDGDNIHAVIKSAVVNHGGRTSGYTAPNPNAQASLILSALQLANVDALSIGYIEAHGTGTELGDPIEITSLCNAFKSYQVPNQSCPIGSVKTNIGHLEAASGVVGVCKVLLQMKHRQIVPSLHSSELNEHIDFKNSPFYVEQGLQAWNHKEIDGVRFPLRAGISSFGAGGSNAHVIVEKYEPPARAEESARSDEQIFPLSAKNEDQLREMAIRLRKHIQQDSSREDAASQQNLNDVAHTLQIGRKSFAHRLAILATTKEELLERLSCFIERKKDEYVLAGHMQNAQGITKLLNRKEKTEFINLLSQSRDPRKLAQLWIDGLLNDWQGCQSLTTAGKISLPTYPFADKRHWAASAPKSAGQVLPASSGIHPLIDSNESTFERQIFKKTFHNRDFVIGDHLVSNIPTLPGVAYLDLARKAGEIAAGRKVRKIRNILWVSPLTVENSRPTETLIELTPSGDSVHFEVFGEGEQGKKQLYSQGKLFYATAQEAEAEPEFIDIQSVRARCTKVCDGKDAYRLFKSFGLDYGPSFQVLQEVFKNENEVLGVLKLPELRNGDLENFILHPSLLDGSLQAGVAAQLGEKAGAMVVPYSIGEVEILHPLQPNCLSYVTEAQDDKRASSKLSRKNVFIVDEAGKILVKIRESVGVPLADVHRKPAQHADADEFHKLYYSHVWERSPLADELGGQGTRDSLLLFDTDERLCDLYRDRLGKAGDSGHVILVQPGNAFEDLGEDRYRINPRIPGDYSQLFQSLSQKKESIEKICYAWPVSGFVHEESFLKEALEKGVYSLLFLCQALMGQKLESKINLLYLYSGAKGNPQPHNDAINGFAKSLQIENPRLCCKTLEIQQEKTDLGKVLDSVLAEFRPSAQDSMTVRYEEQERLVRKLRKLDLAELEDPTVTQGFGLKENGVYLITGGAGGLGLIFAEYLAQQYHAKLVLTGRSELSPERKARLEKLRESGAEVLYLPADISRPEDAGNLVRECKSRFGMINGIIHCAGVLRDSFVRNKTPEEMTAVFAPKLYGTLYLDEATREEGLDFFAMFSSLAAVGGNAGQCDYAYANHFMDSFAFRRETLRSKGERSGKTISYNWSLWADGGMKLDEQTELLFKKNLGIKPLSIETGVEAFAIGLAAKQSQLAVLEAVQDKIERALGLTKTAFPEPEAPGASAAIASEGPITQKADGDLIVLVQNELSKSVMDFLKLDADDLSLDKILLDLGFDSIGLTTFANSINEKYQTDITPVLFFEYPSIKEIASYLSLEQESNVLRYHQASATSTSANAASESVQSAAQTAGVESLPEPLFGIKKGWHPGASDREMSNLSSGKVFTAELRFVNEPIAIVGMSGVMPQSDDLEEFWDNLKNARNMVTLIPEDRWKWQDYDGDPFKERNKTNSKWGGFMKEVDKFDPLFFGISPREAEMMDPQQRIFLATVWKAIEDSGHKVSELSNTRTGLFVGASTKDYVELLVENQIVLDGYSASGNSHSILANRVSFLLNLRGPSAPLDTACSSSLIALHRAIESIHTGSCDMAIVGGVQAILSPGAYITLASAGMLSDDGKCKTFDKRANGYVRGEGAGAIFLKPLARAEADGDHIYAVIKSTAENHGGKVTTLTAPNPNAQYELLMEAYEKAQVDPTTVGYIECHGTGTSLGDPIEIQALKKSFAELYKKHNKAPAQIAHCGLSSVKTNIGHLEPAAGIASILKVLLAIKNKEIPASLHLEELNPYIDLNNSPFYIVDKTRPWEAPMGSDGTSLPRRAGVSSFGWGGANAHVVLEEYIPPKRQSSGAQGLQIVVLSARNEDRLRDYARLMLAHFEKHEIDLADFAYTLQVGRNEMPERLALVVPSVEVLKDKFKEFLLDKKDAENLFRNNTRNKKGRLQSMIEGAAGKIFLQALMEHKDVAKLAELWTFGVEIDWLKLHGADVPRRVSLPSYPFARERHWIPIAERKTAGGQNSAIAAGVEKTIPADRIEDDAVSRMYCRNVWKELALPGFHKESFSSGPFVIFDRRDNVRNTLRESLAGLLPVTPHIALVKTGSEFEELDDSTYQVNPDDPEDYLKLFDSLSKRGQLPENILYLWAQSDSTAEAGSINFSQDENVFSLLYLSQALMQSVKESKKTQAGAGSGRRRKTKLLYIYPGHRQKVQPHHAAVAGFAKCIALENSSCIYKVIEFQDQDLRASLGPAQVAEFILPELQEETVAGVEIRYQAGKRWVKKVEELELSPVTETSLKEKGVYLITGGLGGLGLIFAEHLARQTRARLALTGRSALRPELEEKIEALRSLGSEVIYYEADVSKFEDVERVVADVKLRFQEINGIIHSAGVLRDSAVVRKTAEEMKDVFAAKIQGTINLDEATKGENLDFFALFSSLAAVTGNAGQSDYAYANCFMDNFAELRNQLITDHKRSGKAISFNWPLWQEGGMHIDQHMAAFLEKSLGLRVLQTETGLDAFVQGVANNFHQILVVEGNRQKLLKTLGISGKDAVDDQAGYQSSGAGEGLIKSEGPASGPDDLKLHALLQKDLFQLVVKILGVREDIFAHDIDMSEYGFDSISMAQFFRELSERYSLDLSPTIFFEYPTFSALSQYLTEAYQDQMVEYFQDDLNDSNCAGSHPAAQQEAVASATSEDGSTKSLSESSCDILIPMRTEGNNSPIFAMPGAGGGVLSLRPLSLALGNDQPFYGLQAVGFAGTAPPSGSIEETAMINLAALKTVQPAGPYTLLGYSNGGVVAYEMARMLLEQDETIGALLLLESLCPLARVTDVIEEIAEVSNSVMSGMGHGKVIDVEELKRIPEEERCDFLYDIMNAHGLQLTKEQFSTSYNVSTASDRSCRLYRPSKLSNEIPTLLLRANDGYPDMPEDYGWNQLLASPILVCDVEASHFTIVEKAYVQDVAGNILQFVK